MSDVSNQIVSVAQIDCTYEHYIRKYKDQIGSIVVTLLSTGTDLMIVEQPHCHEGIVKEDVQNDGSNPYENRTKQRGHPERGLESQVPHHKLNQVKLVQEFMNHDFLKITRMCLPRICQYQA